MSSTVSGSPNQTFDSFFSIFYRLTRLQFTPLIILPVSAGATFAYFAHLSFNLEYLALTIAGAVLLHLGANAIDDCYDFQNGVDSAANSIFPKDFGGWKPLPRGRISLRSGKLISFLLLGGSLGFAAFFWYKVGIWSFVLGAIGVISSIIYCAPPFKLDYRGLGLGEFMIFLAFGPIPFLGSYYVQTGQLSLNAILVSAPIGIMTVTILINHDLIFYEVYKQCRKLSLGTVLGRRKALRASLLLSLISYGMIILLVVARIIPIWSIAAPLTGALLLARKSSVYSRSDEPPPYYVPFTGNSLIADWMFTLVLTLSFIL